MKSSLPALLLIVLVGTLAYAVNCFAPPSSGDRSVRTGDGYGSPAIRTGTLSYPRQTIDSDSFVVRIAKPAHRVVSQYWAIDEFAYSVLPPQHVVAVSASAYQENFSNVYPLVRKYHPAIAADPETVLWRDPDLLIVSNSSRADFCDLIRSAHLPIYREFTMYSTLQQVADTIRLTGYLTGEDDAARRATERFWSQIERAKARRPPNAPHPRILGFSGTFSFGRDTLFNDVVKTIGGINVGAEAGLNGYDNVNTEQFIRWNPEWIVAGAYKGQSQQVLAQLLSDPAIQLTQAARNGHILVFEDNVFLPTSPFTTLLVDALSRAIYGPDKKGPDKKNG